MLSRQQALRVPRTFAKPPVLIRQLHGVVLGLLVSALAGSCGSASSNGPSAAVAGVPSSPPRRRVPWPRNPAPDLPPAEDAVAPPAPPPYPGGLERPRLLWRRHFAELDREAELLAAPSGLQSGNPQNVVTLEWAPYTGLLLDLATGRDRAAESGQRHPDPALPAIDAVVRDGTLQVWPRSTPSSAPLWSEADAGQGDEPFASSAFMGESLLVLTPSALVQREAWSGALIRRWPLPEYVAPHVRAHDVTLLANDERWALLLRPRGSSIGLVLTARRGSSALDVLDQPMVDATQRLLIDDKLVVFVETARLVAAFDLATRAAPISSYPPRRALAVLGAEMLSDDDDLCGSAWELPGFEALWFEIASQPENPLWFCAVRWLGGSRTPAALQLFGSLLQRVDGEQAGEVVEALARDDSIETSRRLLPYTRRGRYPAWMNMEDTALAQLWRTGRTSELGLCSTRERARRVEALAPARGGAEIGTRHPLLLQALAADGRWCVICQARADTNGDGEVSVSIGRHGDAMGDVLKPFLVKQSGAGWPFDDLLAVDPKGRYVAVREGACLSLVDTETASVLSLPSADLDDNGRVGPHRGAAFDVSGDQLVYVRGGAGQDVLVVRQLASGAERVVVPGSGRILRARFAGGGAWLELEMIPWGELPRYLTTLAPRRCRGDVGSASFFGASGPKPIRRLLSLRDGSVLEGPDVLGVFDDLALVRRRDGSLALRDATGPDNLIVPAECGGTIAWRDSPRQLLLVACDAASPDASDSVPLWLVRPEGTRVLGTVPPLRGDALSESAEPFASVGDLVVDLDSLQLLPGLPLLPGRARRLYGDAATPPTWLAERTDGAVLVQDAGDDSWDVPPGPLRWLLPAPEGGSPPR